ncbi:D-alanyl-D-alanine carboxypeptidase [Ferrovibrio sp.]|uniref:D-alanyl-D-alanine carboxypeptidase n=1 Tax=Ferrovibrio sp. TaxID=1917215 RepID=UPI00311E1AA2
MRLVAATLGRILPATVTICFIAALLVTLPAAVRAASYSALVVDADTGRVLHAQDADEQRYPASLTKMMTLYMAFDALKDGRLKMNQSLPVSAHAAAQPYGIGLRAGQTITVRDAILAAITKSANNASVVLAEAMGGTESKFAAMMTKRARELGMTSTVFKNASGLPNRAQKSTARDMARLGIALIKDHKSYYTYFSTAEFEWKDAVFPNHNHILKRYEGADGIKTGYIAASGFNLVASAKRDGHRIVAVIFGGSSVKARDNRMVQLLDIGFSKVGDVPATVLAEKKGRDDTSFGLISSAEASTGHSAPRPARKPDAAEAAIGDWAVQLGAFRRPASAEKLLNKVRGKLPEAEPLVEPVEDGKTTLYRARMTGLSEADARTACQKLKREKVTCSVVSPDAG